ncbi:GNAT family N-acetyltransferase [Marinomonas sp. 2405UD68-3]|uniref:GNAT family N-acetyltransferase n=1 Tax=Marinomonas sp. 2405UD68-3 TaxID=3391835 RepID=UPI0039C9E879
MTKIRMAILSDSPAINALSVHLGYAQPLQDIADKRLQCLLDSNTDWVWVYEESNVVLGWIHVFQANRVASAHFFEIGGLVVDLTMRKKGIGRRLIEFVHHECNIEESELRVRCNAKREGAHQFYQKVGFHRSKTQYVFKNELT